jgi:hypothetical protein
VNFSRIRAITPSDIESETDLPTRPLRGKRERERLERDLARGYSINVKQVVLAFAVEFVIIGLILVSRYLFAAGNVNASESKVFLMLTFPIALAMVELARVPLALAVRVQKSWTMKLVAVLGVMGAVVVTSFNLSYIGHATFDPRLDEANEKNSVRLALEARKQSLLDRIKDSENSLQRNRSDLEGVDSRDNLLSSQITTAKQGQNCKTIINETGAKTTNCQTTNPALVALGKQLSVVKQEREKVTTAVQQAEAELKKTQNELGPLDEQIGKARTEYNDILNHSELHSFTAMLFGKSPKDVSEGQVKTLEWYLILIPSIAAALSSTLIAMTAVHRLTPPTPAGGIAMPDDALTYLFGPLISAIRTEARDTVITALKDRTKPTDAAA